MKTVVTILFIWIFMTIYSFAGIIRVPQDQSGIQAAINAAVNGDTVLVDDSTYYENIDFEGKAIIVASYFIMDEDTNHINNTVINGSQHTNPDSGSVISFISGEDTTSILVGFTITQGSGTETSYWWNNTQYFCRSGGGIFCYDSGARIVKNKIIQNSVHSPDKGVSGGGFDATLYGSTAYVILEDNQILYNTVTTNVEDGGWGGGAQIVCNGRLVNNIISFNTVIHKAPTYHSGAGGLGCGSEGSQSNIIIESNKITHNSVISYSNENTITAFGGGVCILGIDGRFTKNEVSYNELWVNSDKNGSGAGIAIQEVPESFRIEGNMIRENAVIRGECYGGGFCIWVTPSVSLINNIIDGNSASRGGALQIGVNSTVKLINNTIINNQATVAGGGIHLTNSSNVFLMNTIMWANQAPTNAGIHIESGSIQVDYSDIQGDWRGTGNINVDPLFLDSEYHLANGSPCIDAGNPDHVYDDPEAPNNPGYAQLPAKGTIINDIGAFGGPGVVSLVPLRIEPSEIEKYPDRIVLLQNYPNPFNPITTIEFTLPRPDNTTLKIYNILSAEVATLVSDKLQAGVYKYTFDGSKLASGVYYYQFLAGEFRDVRKMILLR